MFRSASPPLSLNTSEVRRCTARRRSRSTSYKKTPGLTAGVGRSTDRHLAYCSISQHDDQHTQFGLRPHAREVHWYQDLEGDSVGFRPEFPVKNCRCWQEHRHLAYCSISQHDDQHTQFGSTAASRTTSGLLHEVGFLPDSVLHEVGFRPEFPVDLE